MNSPILDHKCQLEVWKDPARFKMVCAGRRFGKTFLAAEQLLYSSNKPKSLNIYMAPTRTQAKEIIWEHIKKRCRVLGWKANINESDLTIERSNNAKIVLKTAEKPGRVRGLGIDFIVLDEFSEYRNADKLWFQDIRPALSDKKGKALFIFTPKGFNAAYDLFQKAKSEENWNSFSFKTMDSPFFQTPEGMAELDEARRNLSDKDFKQEYEASFESHTGRIYYGFERKINHIDYDYNVDLPIILGQDFNRSPMASALYQQIAGRLIQFSEIFIKTGDTDSTCRELRRLYKNANIIAYPDATGVRRTSNSSLSDFDIMKGYGITIKSGSINPRRVDRWASVNRAYEKKLVMVNVNNCIQTIKDRETMVYKEGTCEPDLNNPMVGHMADAADYPISSLYPIVKHSKIKVSYY